MREPLVILKCKLLKGAQGLCPRLPLGILAVPVSPYKPPISPAVAPGEQAKKLKEVSAVIARESALKIIAKIMSYKLKLRPIGPLKWPKDYYWRGKPRLSPGKSS